MVTCKFWCTTKYSDWLTCHAYLDTGYRARDSKWDIFRLEYLLDDIHGDTAKIDELIDEIKRKIIDSDKPVKLRPKYHPHVYVDEYVYMNGIIYREEPCCNNCATQRVKNCYFGFEKRRRFGENEARTVMYTTKFPIEPKKLLEILEAFRHFIHENLPWQNPLRFNRENYNTIECEKEF